jgi:hypothetical protein
LRLGHEPDSRLASLSEDGRQQASCHQEVGAGQAAIAG